ncbi:amino acid transporter, partial [Hortaea werneckii]
AGSPAASLLIWLVSGLLAWTGAASYAELGGAIPLNGGPQVYLAKIFGEWAGFLFTWCAVTVLKPGSAAIIAIIFGEYIVRAFGGGTVGEEGGSGQWVHKGVAVLGLLVVTGLNCVSTKLGARTSDLFMFLKFVGLLAITGLGIVVAVTGWSYDKEGLATAWRNTNWFEGTSTSTSQWAVALYAGLWAFDGWDNTNYVVGEMKRPGKDLPRVIHTSLPMVIIAYLLANLAYVFVLPTDIINSSNTVAVAFGQTVLGPIGSLVLALVVSGSCFGALNATTFTAGRLIYSAGRENYIPSLFGSIGLTSSSHHHQQPSRLSRQPGFTSRLLSLISDHHQPSAGNSFFATPIPALLLNLTLTSFYIALGDFTTLTTFYGVASYLFYFASVLGLLILRVKEPDLPRPYRCWIFTPVVFCCEEGFALQSTARRFAAQPLLAVEESGGFFGYFDRLAPLVRGEDFAFVSESCPIEPEDAEAAFTVLRWHLRRDWRPLSHPDAEWPLVDGLRQILLHPASAWAFEQITAFLEEVAEGSYEVEIHLFEEEVLERLQGKMGDILARPLVEADLPRGYWDLVQDMLRCAADAMYVGRLVRCSDDGMDDEDEMLYEYGRRRDEGVAAADL